MMKRFNYYMLRNLLVGITIALLLLGCASTPPRAERDTLYKLTILHTNDHHGRFWKNRHGEYGMAARKTLVDQIRAEVSASGGHVLLLDAGDINTGLPESDILKAEPDILAMNRMGYDAMVVGNHEFDNPMEVLRWQEKMMEFPLLAANVYDKDTRKPVFKPHTYFNFDGLQVTVVGFTTEDTYKQGNPENISNLHFEPVIDKARELIPQMRAQCDVLIILAHIGWYPDGQHGGNAPGSVSLARAVDDIDVIIDGHSHEKVEPADMQNGTVIASAMEYGKYLGRMDLEYFNGQLTLKEYRLIPVNLKKKVKKEGKSVRVLIEEEIPEDTELLALLTTFQEKGEAQLGVVIGSADARFIGERKIVRNNETNLGNLACWAYMDKTRADLAVMNSGGIRADLPAGDITYKDVLKVKPFGNSVCTVTMTGAELLEYLTVAVNKEKDTGAFAQFVGVKIAMTGDKPIDVQVQGKPLVADQQYKLVIESYIASGGDGYPKVNDHPNFVDTGYLDADVLREYIANNSPLKSADYAPTNDVVR
jgi:5'-nucleotidase/UDP-sugar diphosphatase